jgi:hypothetical protein
MSGSFTFKKVALTGWNLKGSCRFANPLNKRSDLKIKQGQGRTDWRHRWGLRQNKAWRQKSSSPAFPINAVGNGSLHFARLYKDTCAGQRHTFELINQSSTDKGTQVPFSCCISDKGNQLIYEPA